MLAMLNTVSVVDGLRRGQLAIAADTQPGPSVGEPDGDRDAGRRDAGSRARRAPAGAPPRSRHRTAGWSSRSTVGDPDAAALAWGTGDALGARDAVADGAGRRAGRCRGCRCRRTGCRRRRAGPHPLPPYAARRSSRQAPSKAVPHADTATTAVSRTGRIARSGFGRRHGDRVRGLTKRDGTLAGHVHPRTDPPARPRRAGKPRSRVSPRPSRPCVALDAAEQRIEAELRERFPDADLSKVGEAYRFAREAHGPQRRASGEPYITHPLAVAQILSELGLDPLAVQAALLHDVPEDTEYSISRCRGAVRARGGAPRRRRHQAVQVQRPVPRGAAGGEHPQDVPRDGGGHPRRAHQARRPAAQHAHPGRAADREAAAHRPPDRRRSTRRSPSGWASGSSSGSSRTSASRRSTPRRTGAWPPSWRAAGAPARRTSSGRWRCSGSRWREAGIDAELSGPTQAHLQHPPQDAAQERGAGRDLRHPRACACWWTASATATARWVSCTPCGDPSRASSTTTSRCPRTTATRASTPRSWPGRQAARGPDPDPRDASHQRGRHRGALALQGRLAHRPGLRRQARLAAPAHGLAARGLGRHRVRGGRQARHLPGPGVRVHAPRRCQGPARGRHAARLRLPHPHRRRPRLHRRQGQQPPGVARLQAQERRHRRDRDHQERPRSVARLAQHRHHEPCQGEDPAVVQAPAA